MHVHESLEEVLSVLNGRRIRALEEHRQRAGNRAASPDEYRAAKSHLSERLRRYIDEWMETGRTRGTEHRRGKEREYLIESPATRNLSATRKAKSAVAIYDSEHPPKQIAIEIGKFDLIYARPEHFSNDPLVFADHESKRQFAAIVASDWAAKLCFCQRCEQYFEHVNKLREKPYKHGMFCTSVHRRNYSAEKATRERREDSDELLVKYSAKRLIEYWAKTPKWRGRNPFALWLLPQLNVFAAGNPNVLRRHPLTKKWVTQYVGKIEHTVRELGVLGCPARPSKNSE